MLHLPGMVTEKEYDAIERDALKQSNGNENGWDTKEDGSQSESASEHEADEGKEITYRDVQLEEPSHPQLRSALDDPDTELWLVRVPRHDALRTGIEGTEIRTLDLPHEDSFGNDDRRAGVAIGNYVYREQSLVDETMRPAFVTTDKSGKAVMKVGTWCPRLSNLRSLFRERTLTIG